MKFRSQYLLIVALCQFLCTTYYLYGTEFRVLSASQIATAMSQSQPGDTLTMVNGTWVNESIMFAGYGTETKPILLRGESYGGVILTGTSTLRISGKHLIADGLLFRNGYSPSGAIVEFQGDNGESDSCRLSNSSIINYNPTDLTIDYKWVSLFGTHNRVDHCYIGGKRHQGSTIVVWVDALKSNFHQIDHNYFGPRPSLPNNGGETIRIGTGVVSTTRSFTLVEYNYFEACNGDAEIVSNKSCDNTYRFNTFVNCLGTLSMRQGNRATIEGNFFFGNNVSGTGAIRLTGEDHKVFNNYINGVYDDESGCGLALMNGTVSGVSPSYPQVKRAIIAFNTFVGNRYSIGFGVNSNSGTLPPDSCLLANNVVYTTSAKPVITVYTSPTHLSFLGNIFFGSSLGITQPTGIKWENPMLAQGQDGLLRPILPSSPAINASDSASMFQFVTLDMDGQPRDTLPDVGADEYSTSPVINRPLTPSDVGPPQGMITSVDNRDVTGGSFPKGIVLEQNYPNPFNPTTTISFSIPTQAQVRLQIFNVLGQMIDEPMNKILPAGRKSILWSSKFGSGVFFFRLEVESESDHTLRYSVIRKMTLLR